MAGLWFEVRNGAMILHCDSVNRCFHFHNSHSYLRKSCMWSYYNFFQERWKEFHYLARKTLLTSTYETYRGNLGCQIYEVHEHN